ncbi:MAG: YfcL family protein [Ferrimonas sp.]
MIEQWDQLCQHWLHEQVTRGSDDDVFASGYLQGHFAVVLAQLDRQPNVAFSQLQQQMETSLVEAKNELAPADLALVQHAWQQLSSHLQQA